MNLFQQVSFEEFIKEYKNQLNPQLSIHPAVAEMFRGKTMVAYEQIIRQMTKNNTVPLLMFFDSKNSMTQISKRNDLIESILKFLDINKLGRIDSYEFLVPILIFLDGKFDKFWEYLVDNFGVDQRDKISRDEFYYLVDTMFRGFAKLLVKANENPFDYQPKRYRLLAMDINNIVATIFAEGVTHIEKTKIKEAAHRMPQLVEFLEYVHKLTIECTSMKNKDKIDALNPNKR